MKPVIQLFGESFLYSCSFDKATVYEQFVPEHVLVYQISGQTQIYHQRGEMLLQEGDILLARRNKARNTTLGARRHQVAKPDIGERAPHHHFMVTAARPIRIEVDRLHA